MYKIKPILASQIIYFIYIKVDKISHFTSDKNLYKIFYEIKYYHSINFNQIIPSVYNLTYLTT